MVQKKLQPESQYNEYDLDKDGIVSDEELNTVKSIHETEMQEEKADAQRRMAWVSLIAMLVFTVFVFLPVFPDSRIKASFSAIKPSSFASSSICITIQTFCGSSSWAPRKSGVIPAAACIS